MSILISQREWLHWLEELRCISHHLSISEENLCRGRAQLEDVAQGLKNLSCLTTNLQERSRQAAQLVDEMNSVIDSPLVLYYDKSHGGI